VNKLEHYLDQVCRSIGGPRALRQHVRQELREHLLDAAAGHKAAGASEEAALDKALAEFGRPEDVRSELEATHGHRMMAVVIDRALQWKEMTMRAKWLWTTWANLALALVVVLGVLFITFNVTHIIPRYQKLTRDGIVDLRSMEQQGLMWISEFPNRLSEFTGHYTTWLLLAAIVAWALFEWRVKSENKQFMRLSALGTAAVAVMVVIVFMAGSLAISFEMGVPAVGRMVRPFALDQIAKVDASVGALEQALAAKDWKSAAQAADQASSALNNLADGPALQSLTKWDESPTGDELRAHWKAASEAFREVRPAIAEKEPGRLETALQRFRLAYEPVREAAKRAAR
jgi:hypothetical protein